MRKSATMICIALLLCSCGDDTTVDSLKSELESQAAEMPGKPRPLSALRTVPEARYQAAGLPDPFYPDRR